MPTRQRNALDEKKKDASVHELMGVVRLRGKVSECFCKLFSQGCVVLDRQRKQRLQDKFLAHHEAGAVALTQVPKGCPDVDTTCMVAVIHELKEHGKIST
ncbi:unnamed protein product, partial [Aphanomyces euteiches]